MRKAIFILISLSVQVAMAQNHDIRNSFNWKGIPQEVVSADGITVPVFKFSELSSNLHSAGDTTYVINFWATWCKPCIEELPDFLKVRDELKNEQVVFLFVNLDFRRNLETVVIPFLKSNRLTENVAMLHDPQANEWIDQVDTEWSGAIPATLIFRKESRVFIEKALSYYELLSIIQTIKSDKNESN